MSRKVFEQSPRSEVRKASAQKNPGGFAPEKKGILQEKIVAEIDVWERKGVRPPYNWEKEFEQCELSHDIMRQIYREDQKAFFEIATDSDVNAGMVLKNILGAYAWVGSDPEKRTSVLSK